MKTQHQLSSAVERSLANANETMLHLLYGPNPITDDELRALIAKRPHVYGRFSSYLGTREERS